MSEIAMELNGYNKWYIKSRDRVYIENQQSPISPHDSVYFVNFYRGFTVLTDFQEDIKTLT